MATRNNQARRAAGERQKRDSPRTRKPPATTSVTTYDASGRPVRTVSRTPMQQEEKPAKTAQDYGVSAGFLEKYPDMVEFVNRAIDNDYEPDRFMAELEQTDFGKERTQAQEAFDIAIEGPQVEDLQKKIDDRVSQLKQEFMAAGIQLSESELNRFGREIVRSDLSNQDVLAFMASQFSVPSGGGDMAGVSSQIYAELRDMARQYGLTMSDSTLQSKVRTGIEQGSNWQSWVEGQRNVFREQAKLQYPTLGDRLNDYTVDQLMEPYLNDAADLLGLSRQQLSAMDPMWQKALNGPNGPLSRDEWMRTLKTDPKYGWDRTVRARQEYSYLADELLSVFGMA